jgi:hypothetical protein
MEEGRTPSNLKKRFPSGSFSSELSIVMTTSRFRSSTVVVSFESKKR